MFNCSIQFSVLITKHYIIRKNVLMIKYKPILQEKKKDGIGTAQICIKDNDSKYLSL